MEGTIQERIELYDKVMSLKSNGWNYRRIADELGINKYTVWDWINRGRHPATGFNIPDLSPSHELSYLIGVMWGDGYANRKRHTVVLSATDRDFVEEFNNCVSKVLSNHPCSISTPSPRVGRKQMYTTEVGSRVLCEYFKEPFSTHMKAIEKYPSSFLRGFYDSEGSVILSDYERRVDATNTKLFLLNFVKTLLHNVFRIPSRLCLHQKSGMYHSKKDVYRLIIRCNGIPAFYDKIGFSIERKQRKLLEVVKSIRRTRKHLREEYARAMSLHKSTGWGGMKLARATGIDRGAIDAWLYQGKKPWDAKEELNKI